MSALRLSQKASSTSPIKTMNKKLEKIVTERATNYRRSAQRHREEGWSKIADEEEKEALLLESLKACVEALETAMDDAEWCPWCECDMFRGDPQHLETCKGVAALTLVNRAIGSSCQCPIEAMKAYQTQREILFQVTEKEALKACVEAVEKSGDETYKSGGIAYRHCCGVYAEQPHNNKCYIKKAITLVNRAMGVSQ